MEADGILGIDFLQKAKASFVFGRRLLRLQKLPMSIRAFDSRKRRGVKEKADRATPTAFSHRDGTRCRVKQTPRHDRADGKSEKNSVSKHEPCSRSKREDALKIDAEVAKIKSRHNNES